MMKLALFLHAYQPPTQFRKITSEIADRSYAPLVSLLEASESNSKITMNISGSLIEQLRALKKFDVLDRYRTQVERGKIEFVGTAAYHPLITKLPDHEIIRQDEVNEYWLKKWLGEKYHKPNGFFIPEMVYDRRVGEVIAKRRYQWIILDESAFPGAGVSEHGQHQELGISTHSYKLLGTNLSVLFRDRPVSLALAFDRTLNIGSLLTLIKRHEREAKDAYVVLAVDAETFGHHNSHNLSLFAQLLSQDEIELVTVRELVDLIPETRFIEPVESSWGVSIEQKDGEREFPRWDNPDNKIHKLQWELFNLAIAQGKHTSVEPDELDKALHSDQFWWASKVPCWHPGMVLKGTDSLFRVFKMSSDKDSFQRAERIVSQIKECVNAYSRKIVQ